jgi:hypothetical protein
VSEEQGTSIVEALREIQALLVEIKEELKKEKKP